jgi:hypothetical protein
MRRLICGVMLTATLLWSVSSGAQQRPTLKVVIEELDQDAATCGINSSSIESITALTLRNNGIQVVASSSPYLYVQLTIIPMRNNNILIGCANNVTVAVRATGPAPLGRFKPRKGYVATSLCESGAIISGSVSSFSKQTNDTLEQHIKICLGELDY